MKVRLAVISSVAVAFLMAGNVSWAAEDGAALFKKRCTNCHGPNGEGKAAMKAPAVKGSSMSADDVEQFILKGAAGKKAPHGKAVSGLNAEQAKAIAAYIKTL
jgi:mono/diheme cytochrome c family protein